VKITIALAGAALAAGLTAGAIKRYLAERYLALSDSKI